MLYRKGDVFFTKVVSASFNPRLYSKKDRPYVILQNTKAGQENVFVAPLSAAVKETNSNYACTVQFKKRSVVHLESSIPFHINLISKIEYRLSEQDIQKIDRHRRRLFDGETVGNIEDIKGVSSLVEIDEEFISGMILLKGGASKPYMIPKKVFANIFKHVDDTQIIQSLETLKGIQLCIKFSK